MEILGAFIERYEYLGNIQIPLETSTLLFGKNGAGKSTLLEALVSGWHRHDTDTRVGYAVRLAEADASWLAEVLSFGAAGRIHRLKKAVTDLATTFDFTAVEGAEDVDLQGLSDVAGRYKRALDEAEKLVPADTTWAASLSSLRQRLTPGDSDRRTGVTDVCNQLLAAPVIVVDHKKPTSRAGQLEQALSALGIETHIRRRASLGVDKRKLTEQQLSTWAASVAELAEDAPLRTAQTRMLAEDGPIVAILELGPLYGDEWVAPAPVNVFDASSQGIEQAIEDAVPTIFALLVGSPYATGDDPLAFERQDGSDPWFQAIDPGYDDDAFELRPGILDVLSAIQTTANDIAPKFVQEVGTISIAPVPLNRMTRGPRVTISFGDSDLPLPLDRVGAGTQRWISATVREACRVLSTLKRTYIEIDGDSYHGDDEELDDLVVDNCHVPLTLDQIEYHLPPAPGIFLADEPELHLHPAAVADVRTWLEARTSQGLTVVAATHSTRLLNMASQLVEHLHVQATRDGPLVRRVGPELLTFLQQSAAEAGVEPGDVLQVTRAIAVVEGQHDVEVIRHFYAAEFAAARVLMLRLEGTGNSNALVESEFLAGQQIPMRVLFDNVSSTLSMNTDEERVTARLQRRAEELNVQLTVVPFDLPDIVAALPEAAVRRAFPDATFDGWDPLVEHWRRLQARQFKTWALNQMGLSRLRPTQFIRSVLEMVDPSERPSPKLERAVRELLVLPA